jgi:valyl-tRNA synthetase
MNEAQQSAPMATAFDPQPVEARWSESWLQQEIGKPRPIEPGAKPYCITIPPPNVTGVLHLGHALQHSIHDCLIRYHRMTGRPTLCVPGTDHAGIATQMKVMDQLADEGLSRLDLGREQFEARTWAWKEKYGGTIISQMKALGCSYDWSRERFTMDPAYVKAVLTVFKAWFDRGLIYRGYRLVNWSVGAQTTVSDLEIDTREVQGNLWHFKYPIEGREGEFVVVATTRPETMLGDTAVAVHPDDERYSHLRDHKVILPLQNRAIPLIFDDQVDKEFGTGAVKVTPAHDQADYEMGVRHDLPNITVIGFDGRITPEGGAYVGLTREEARIQVIKDLKALGLVEKIEQYTHSVPFCARTGTVIEPLLSEQWFVAMKELARPVADAIRMGRVEYSPERFANTSLAWLDNIRDWCISRQLWWGHRIPVYYGPQGEVKCSVEPITEPGWTQDEDVLDTWFSSALWPFAVLGWPDALEKEWYPTNVLITGRDILHLWVSRMITTSLDFVETPEGHGEIPFHDVLVHPTVQDIFGLRMSKSLGTGIDPMELINNYGADATRFGLLQLAGGAQDVRFIDLAESQLGETFVRNWLVTHRGEPLPLVWEGKPTERYPQMQSARNFANKIWNASRLVLSAEVAPSANGTEPDNSDLGARWIVSRLNATIEDVTRAIENYDFDVATQTLYSFIWGDYCDWFLEVSKPKLRAGEAGHIALMTHVLETTMRLLHPFMPFLSEEIWSRLPKNSAAPCLALAEWPKGGPRDLAAEAEFSLLQEAVGNTRRLRNEANIPLGKKIEVTFVALTPNSELTLREGVPYLTLLANLEAACIVTADAPRPANALSATLPELEVYLPLEGLIDVEKETARLQKQLDTAEKDLERVIAKLQNPNFAGKAPQAVVEKEEAKRAELTTTVTKLRERLAAL